MTKKTLSESWLEGEIPLHMGLRFWAAIDDIAHFGVREARDAFQGYSEEHARLIWEILETHFNEWKLIHKGAAKAPDKKSPEAVTDFLMQVYVGNNPHFVSNYDLLSMLRREGYEPLKDFEKEKSPEKVLAALVLHDCANDKGHEVHGAIYELTCRNWLNRGRKGKDAPPEVLKQMALIQEKLEQSRRNLALGPKKGGETIKRRSQDAADLFSILYRDSMRKEPEGNKDVHVKFVYDWVTKHNMTINGTLKKVPYDGHVYEVMTGGSKSYKIGTIGRKLSGAKKRLRKKLK